MWIGLLLSVAPTSAAQYAATDLRTRDELVILVFGDAGTGESGQYRVGRAMYEVCLARSCDLALMPGDNIYENGIVVTERNDAEASFREIQRQFQAKFEVAYEPFASISGFRFWGVLGNHDYRKNAGWSMITYSEFSELWRIPAFHYQIPLLPEWIQIYGVHTDTDEGRDLNGLQIRSARRSLCASENPDRWKLLFGHQPVYNSGHHRGDGNERRARSLLEQPLIRQCGVHLYLSGHAHHQEHLTADGFEQIVQGAAAKSKGSNGYKNSARLRQGYFKKAFGFAVIEVDRDRLLLDFYDVVHTKEKGKQSETPRPEEIVRSYSWCASRADVGKPAKESLTCN